MSEIKRPTPDRITLAREIAADADHDCPDGRLLTAELVTEIDALQAENAEHLRTIEALRSELEETKTAVEALLTANDALREHIESVRSEHLYTIEALRDQLSAHVIRANLAEAELRSEHAKYTEAQRAADVNFDEWKKQRERREKAEADVAILEGRFTDNDLWAARKRIADLEQQLEKTKREV